MRGLIALALAVSCVALVWFCARGSFGSAGRGGSAPRIAPEDVASMGTPAPEPALQVQREATAVHELAAPPAGVVFVGRVADAAHLAVPGATVTVALPGHAPLTGTSDAEGRFQILGPERPRAGCTRLVRAFDGQGRTAFDSRWMQGTEPQGPFQASPDPPGAEEDLGLLVLEKAHDVAVRVTRDGLPQSAVRVRAELPHRYASLDAALTDEHGLARFAALPADWITFEARLEDAEALAAVFVPDPERATVELRLEPLRALDVWVVDAQTGRGIAGATLEVQESVWVPAIGRSERDLGTPGEFVCERPLGLAVPPTDAEGHTRIEGLPRRGSLEVRPHAVGYEPFSRHYTEDPSQPVPRDASELRFALEPRPARTVRWPVVAGEVAPPPEGSELALALESSWRSSGVPTPRSGVMEDGFLVVAGVPLGSMGFRVEAPDGSLTVARVSEDPSQLRPISFRRPRTIAVRVTDPAGAPCAGLVVRAADPGNNALGALLRTDAEGRALLAGLYGAKVNVQVGGERALFPVRSQHAVDISAEDARVEVVLAPPGEVVLRFLENGVPRLAPHTGIFAPTGAWITGEMPERGELRVQVLAPESSGPLSLSIRPEGYLAVRKELTLPLPGPPLVLEIALVPAPVLVLHVDPPASRHTEFTAEVWDAEAARWKQASPWAELSQPNGPGGVYRFETLAPGRARARAKETGIVTSEVFLDARRPEAHVFLDLSQVILVRGTLEAPQDADLRLACVLASGPHLEPPGEGWLPGGEPPEGAPAWTGRFELQVDATQPVLLRAWHPTLVPDGEVVVSSSRDDVVLRLKAGREVRIPMHALAEELRLPSVRVLAYRGDPIGAPAAFFHAPVTDGIARFAGLEPGTWTLWIDPGRRYAPLVLRDVTTSEGVTLLPEPAFERGSTLRVRVVVPPGEIAPELSLWSWHDAPPKYVRSARMEGAFAVVSGLGAGLFRVQGAGQPERRLEVDGLQDVEWSLGP